MSSQKICEKAIFELAGGDVGALSVIYENMSRQIFALAYTITGNYCDAEDVLQNTMIDITRACHGYGGGNPKAWIMTLARHNAIDIVRKRRGEADFVLEEITGGDEALSSDGFSMVETMDMLNILGEDEKQVVLMRLYSEMPYREIAAVMGIKIFAAQKKYQRAISKLKKYNPR
ncbi:MAG: sigma-70 family RNA polymerase sigma factor [Clostridia bacterium]|nr:sigma-70 family RNA polymerase sigma factor [Clostridia bacterium]